jgi:hypothetical protein
MPKFLVPIAVLAALTAALLTDHITGTQFLGGMAASGLLVAAPSPFGKQ